MIVSNHINAQEKNIDTYVRTHFFWDTRYNSVNVLEFVRKLYNYNLNTHDMLSYFSFYFSTPCMDF